MLNSKILLNKNVEVEYRGEKFALKQPSFIEFINYSSMEFETMEARAKYLYSFFEVPIRHLSVDLIDYMHNLLMNYKPKVEKEEEKKEDEEKETPDFIITDIDVVYVLAKFLHFYKSYTHEAVYKMPVSLFFDLYSKIDIIQAEVDTKQMDLFSMPAYLKTEKGVEYVNEIKKDNKEKMNKVFVIKVVDKTKENWEKITNFFNNNEIGKPKQKG